MRQRTIGAALALLAASAVLATAGPAAAQDDPGQDEIEPLTGAEAVSLVRADLVRRGGKRYGKARVLCPASVASESPVRPANPHLRLCRTHLRTGKYASIAEYRVDSTERPVTVRRVSKRRYRVALRRCRVNGGGRVNTQPNRVYSSTWRVGGRFDCRDMRITDSKHIGISRFPRALPRRVTVNVAPPAEDGVGVPEYGAFDRMTCRTTSGRRRSGRRTYVLRCANRVGDRFEMRVTVRYARRADNMREYRGVPRPAALLLAASRRPVMQARYRYQGDTGQDLDPRKGTYIGGYLGLYTDSRKRIHGAELTYRCPGQRHQRRTVLSAENVPGFKPVKVRNRKIRLRWTAGWYHNSTGGDGRGTNTVTVRANLYRKQPAQRNTPRSQRMYMLAKGTVRVVDGACKVRTRVVIHRSGRQTDPGLGTS